MCSHSQGFYGSNNLSESVHPEPTKYNLTLPDGDPRKVSLRWSEQQGNTHNLCISVSSPPLIPVPISEQPWKRQDWCDPMGYCWVFNPLTESWCFTHHAVGRKWADLMLPFRALPLPTDRP